MSHNQNLVRDKFHESNINNKKGNKKECGRLAINPLDAPRCFYPKNQERMLATPNTIATTNMPTMASRS